MNDARASEPRSWGPTLWARRLARCRSWRLYCSEHHLHIEQGKEKQIRPLWQLTQVAITSGIAWQTCRLTLLLVDEKDVAQPAESETITLPGLSRQTSTELQAALRQQVLQVVAVELESLSDALDSWKRDADKLIAQQAWIRQSQIDQLVLQRASLQGHVTGMPAGVVIDHPIVGSFDSLPLPESMRSKVKASLSDALIDCVPQYNAAIAEREIIRQADFFAGVESHPLTDEQAYAAVCFDDRVRLIASAGSGKTSTMVARAGYAIRTGIAQPEEILLLAFNTDAAQELRDRILTNLKPWVTGADKIEVATFHAFSLKVIGDVTGRKPSVPSWLGKGQDLGVIVRIVHDLMKTDPSFKAAVELFCVVLKDDLVAFKKLPRHAANTHDPLMTTADERIVTMRGEVVKSQEEKALADWLLLHGIDYCYERPYHKDTATAEHAQYHPDFYYPEIDLYHEHFALDAEGRPPPHFENYADGVAWKRELHRQDGNRYMETTSHQLREGTAFEHLRTTLEQYGLSPSASLKNLNEQAEPMAVPELAKILRTFMHHFKGNMHTPELIEKKAQRMMHFTFRVKLFLRIYSAVQELWDQRLKDEGGVDFDDMLNTAASLIEEGHWQSPYRMVSVDEWQDTSAARARLAKALNSQGGSLFVVGDDYQGVYAFAGADIRYMTEFDTLIGKGSTLFLTETFRCPQSLNDMATAFIMANPAQIEKSVRSHNPMQGRSVRSIVHSKGELADCLFDELRRLDAHAQARGQVFDILLLGRYRFDCPEELNHWQQSLSSHLQVRFSTVHQAKGLEYDYVFLLNLNNGKNGFPADKEEDSLITLVMAEADPYPHAEERRLFYVALTRAKRRVVLLTEEERVSSFIRELEPHGLPPLRRQDGSLLEYCTQCGVGIMVTRQGRRGEFQGCSHFPVCRHSKPRPAASARF